MKKLWVDDMRLPPEGWLWARSVNGAKKIIEAQEAIKSPVEIIDVDHDAGDYFYMGGDYIELLKWLEETGRKYKIRIHSMNPVGVANMRAIIQHNEWEEV